MYFFTLLEAGKSEMQWLVSGEGHCAVSSHGGRQKGKRVCTCERGERGEGALISHFFGVTPLNTVALGKVSSTPTLGDTSKP